jgi:hypothetical protein
MGVGLSRDKPHKVIRCVVGLMKQGRDFYCLLAAVQYGMWVLRRFVV